MSKPILSIYFFNQLELMENEPTNIKQLFARYGFKNVIDMFLYYVEKGKIDGKGIKIITVYLSNEEEIGEYGEYLDIKSKIDFSDIDIHRFSAREAKEYFLLKIYNILLPSLIEKGIDISKFEKIIALIKEKNFVFEEKWKSEWNLSKNIKAAIRFVYKDRLDFYLDIFDRSNQIKETIPFITTHASLGLIELCLGCLKWKDDDTLLLYQENNRDYWQINILTKEIDFIYIPAIEDNPYKQYRQYNLALRYLDGLYGVPQNVEKAKYWLKKSAEQGLPKAIKLLTQLNSTK